ncbi:hypothetical protein LDENG_00120670 [Lucifuga dentata]|nr:hypothetical protein LDENG_00120670 [Lucifuga dentata]
MQLLKERGINLKKQQKELHHDEKRETAAVQKSIRPAEIHRFIHQTRRVQAGKRIFRCDEMMMELVNFLRVLSPSTPFTCISD